MKSTRGNDGVLRASVGDRLVVRSLHGPARDGEILDVRNPDGTPPYWVRWSDNGHEALVYPGPDASVQHFPHDFGP
jgi:hypothetical protein